MALSTYYDAKTRPTAARARSDALLGPALVALSEDNYCVYGAHKLWKAARRAGHDVGRDQARAEPVRFRFTSRGRFSFTIKAPSSGASNSNPGTPRPCALRPRPAVKSA
jgi:hypothetical protein